MSSPATVMTDTSGAGEAEGAFDAFARVLQPLATSAAAITIVIRNRDIENSSAGHQEMQELCQLSSFVESVEYGPEQAAPAAELRESVREITTNSRNFPCYSPKSAIRSSIQRAAHPRRRKGSQQSFGIGRSPRGVDHG